MRATKSDGLIAYLRGPEGSCPCPEALASELSANQSACCRVMIADSAHCSRDPRGRQLAKMSSYKEFLEEARILSSTTAPSNEDIPIPITVPHSRPRGTWGQWMKEFTLPPDVLDSIVRRYDSKSWSATGGRSSARVPGEGSRVSSTSAALSWSSVAGSRDGATKEGGATTTARTMRGVSTSGARRRPMTSGRARALLRHSETPQKEARRPGEVSRYVGQ